jgi:hypothetical protein
MVLHEQIATFYTAYCRESANLALFAPMIKVLMRQLGIKIEYTSTQRNTLGYIERVILVLQTHRLKG